MTEQKANKWGVVPPWCQATGLAFKKNRRAFKMKLLKKDESKQQEKNFEGFEALTRSELHFIRGGDTTNNEDDGKQ